jgi:hypothetical protein
MREACQEGETGQSWADCHAYLRIAKPRMIILENVVALEQVSNEVESSDAQHIIEELSKLQYAARWTHVKAQLHGSFARRERIYLLGLKVDEPQQFDGISTALAELDGLMASLQMEPFPLQSFLQETPIAPASASTVRTFEAQSELWKDTKEIYNQDGIAYPPCLEDFSAEFKLACSSLTDRQIQVVAYMMLRYPVCDMGGKCHAIDFNFSLSRLRSRSWCIDCAPTLVGSSKALSCVHDFR